MVVVVLLLRELLLLLLLLPISPSSNSRLGLSSLMSCQHDSNLRCLLQRSESAGCTSETCEATMLILDRWKRRPKRRLLLLLLLLLLAFCRSRRGAVVATRRLRRRRADEGVDLRGAQRRGARAARLAALAELGLHARARPAVARLAVGAAQDRMRRAEVVGVTERFSLTTE